MRKVYSGFSLLEIMIAIGIFTVVVTGILGVVSSGSSLGRKSSDNSKALLYAQEGIEVVSHLKTTDWTQLVNGTYGLDSSSGEWVLDSTPDVYGKYTREVILEDALRDSEGNLAEEGSLDPLMKKVTVKVSWLDKGTISREIENTRYLSFWERDILRPGHSMLVYADFSGSDDVIKYKTLNFFGNWSEENTVPDFGVPSEEDLRRIELFSSTTRDEKIMITKHVGTDQSLYAQIWNGDEWAEVALLATYPNSDNPHTRNYDGFYMQNGNFMLAYDDNTTSPKYRVWDGDSWTGEETIGDAGGIPVWVVARGRPNSNDGMFAVRDDLQHTNTFYWDGDSWDSPEEHATDSSGMTRENIAFEWSRHDSQYGLLMYNDAEDNRPNLRVWDNSTKAWEASVENENVGGRARIYQIVESPLTEKFLGCVKDSNRTVNCLYTDLTPEWSSSFRIASNTNDTDTRSYSLGFESISGELALMVYAEGGTDIARRIPKYRTYNPITDEYSPEYELPELGPDTSYMLESVRIVADPIFDNIMVLMADSSQRLYTIGWDGVTNQFNSSGDLGFVSHAENGSNDEDFWYDFDW